MKTSIRLLAVGLLLATSSALAGGNGGTSGPGRAACSAKAASAADQCRTITTDGQLAKNDFCTGAAHSGRSDRRRAATTGRTTQ